MSTGTLPHLESAVGTLVDFLSQVALNVVEGDSPVGPRLGCW